MSCSSGAAKSIDGNTEVILKADDEIQTPNAKVHYKNLYVAGKVWVEALKSSLRHTRSRLSPVVHSDKDVPEKPPPMRYEDLPIYESPHYKYKQYIEDLQKNPSADKKLLQNFLFPIVQKYRQPLTESISKMKNDIKGMGDETQEIVNERVNSFKIFMRDPNNLIISRTVFGLSTVTGIYIGSGTRSVIRKLFGGTLGALGGGALCFPKETDVVFKDTLYIIGRLAVAMYNATFGTTYGLKKQLPGPENLKTDSKSKI